MKPEEKHIEVEFFTEEYYKLKAENKISISAELEEAVKKINSPCFYLKTIKND